MGRESMLSHINKMVTVILDDDRTLTGKFLAYDRHMNVVLSDTVERRPETAKMKREGISAERNLGLVMLRGERVISLTVVAKGANNSSEPNFDKAPKEKRAVGKRAREE